MARLSSFASRKAAFIDPGINMLRNICGVIHFLDATQWRTYRVTARSNQFKVYVDENPVPVIMGPLTSESQSNRVMFGSGASAGTASLLP